MKSRRDLNEGCSLKTGIIIQIIVGIIGTTLSVFSMQLILLPGCIILLLFLCNTPTAIRTKNSIALLFLASIGIGAALIFSIIYSFRLSPIAAQGPIGILLVVHCIIFSIVGVKSTNTLPSGRCIYQIKTLPLQYSLLSLIGFIILCGILNLFVSNIGLTVLGLALAIVGGFVTYKLFDIEPTNIFLRGSLIMLGGALGATLGFSIFMAYGIVRRGFW